MTNSGPMLRKLGTDETVYDFETLSGGFILCVVVRAELADLSKLTLPLVRKACGYWARRYPLLDAKIVRDDLAESRRRITLGSTFVSRNSDQLVAFESNVDELVTAEPSEWSSQVVESELTKPLDLIDGPLWRLKLVKLTTQSAAHFVFTFHHAITDGRNSCICIRLLDICAALMDERHCAEMDEKNTIVASPLCLEDMVAAYVANGKLKLDPALRRDHELDARFRMPKTVGETGDGGDWACWEVLVIGAERLHAIKRQLKAKTGGVAKLNAFLETMKCLALKQTLLKYGETDLASLSFQYWTFASVRDKLELDNEQMGVYSVGLISRLDEAEIELNLDTFWRACESVSTHLHERLANDEDVASVMEGYDFGEFERSRAIHERSFSHGVSNIGRVEGTRPSASLRASELYFGFSMHEDRFISTLISIVATLDDTLTWAISFNEKQFKRDFVRDLIANINTNIEKLLAD